MAAVPATRALQISGVLLFAAGALLLGFGASSVLLFVVYAVITFGGASLFLTGTTLRQRSARARGRRETERRSPVRR